MRLLRWLMCGVAMACTHHSPPPAPADPTVGTLENPCPSPKTASADAAEYERFVGTKWCRISEAPDEVATLEMTFGKDGREIERQWITDGKGQHRHGDKVVHESCWRLEDKQLHEV